MFNLTVRVPVEVGVRQVGPDCGGTRMKRVSKHSAHLEQCRCANLESLSPFNAVFVDSFVCGYAVSSPCAFYSRSTLKNECNLLSSWCLLMLIQAVSSILFLDIKKLSYGKLYRVTLNMLFRL